jgi:hypothetical protein
MTLPRGGDGPAQRDRAAGADFNKFTAFAHGGQRAASLSGVMAGNLERSLRQRELRRPSGFQDELRVVCSDGTAAWGR